MITESRLRQSDALEEWIRDRVQALALPDSLRTRVAGTCFVVAQEHHRAIALLLGHNIAAGAFALARVQFEAYVRGLWLQLCATDAGVKGYFLGKPPPKIDDMIRSIESTPSFSEGRLSSIKARIWNSVCEYTHTGSMQVQRWYTETSIEATYKPEEALELLAFSEALALMSMIALSEFTQDTALASEALERLKAKVEK